MNDVLKTIAERYSCRGYQNKAVEPELVETIAKAGLHAPSALNAQPWHIIAINNKQLIDEINDHVMELLKVAEDKTAYNRLMERGGTAYYNAPVMFLVLKQKEAHAWADIDCGIVVQNMTLAASSLGLGNVIAAMAATAFAGPKADEFKTKVKWPEDYDFGIGLLVGYPEVTKEPHELDESKLTFI